MNRLTFSLLPACGSAVVLVLLLAGCSLPGVRPTTHESYDFGPLPAAAGQPRSHWVIDIPDVSVPSALESSAMSYRLDYSSPAQPRTYANSEWTMSPGELLTHRIKARFSEQYVIVADDQIRRDFTLRLHLEEFSQIFESADHSHARIRIRATLIKNAGAVLAQSTFSLEQPAPTADAAGGVAALGQASDAAVDALLAWMHQNIR
jgi:cholesterol transport system auxiliary component